MSVAGLSEAMPGDSGASNEELRFFCFLFSGSDTLAGVHSADTLVFEKCLERNGGKQKVMSSFSKLRTKHLNLSTVVT